MHLLHRCMMNKGHIFFCDNSYNELKELADSRSLPYVYGSAGGAFLVNKELYLAYGGKMNISMVEDWKMWNG